MLMFTCNVSASSMMRLPDDGACSSRASQLATKGTAAAPPTRAASEWHEEPVMIKFLQTIRQHKLHQCPKDAGPRSWQAVREELVAVFPEDAIPPAFLLPIEYTKLYRPAAAGYFSVHPASNLTGSAALALEMVPEDTSGRRDSWLRAIGRHDLIPEQPSQLSVPSPIKRARSIAPEEVQQAAVLSDPSSSQTSNSSAPVAVRVCKRRQRNLTAMAIRDERFLTILLGVVAKHHAHLSSSPALLKTVHCDLLGCVGAKYKDLTADSMREIYSKFKHAVLRQRQQGTLSAGSAGGAAQQMLELNDDHARSQAPARPPKALQQLRQALASCSEHQCVLTPPLRWSSTMPYILPMLFDVSCHQQAACRVDTKRSNIVTISSIASNSPAGTELSAAAMAAIPAGLEEYCSYLDNAEGSTTSKDADNEDEQYWVSS